MNIEKLNLLAKKIEEYTISKKTTITDEQRSEILLPIEEIVAEAEQIIEYADYLRKKLRKVKSLGANPQSHE
jgi:hypothetical protein